jgi:hypothetical protein
LFEFAKFTDIFKSRAPEYSIYLYSVDRCVRNKPVMLAKSVDFGRKSKLDTELIIIDSSNLDISLPVDKKL